MSLSITASVRRAASASAASKLVPGCHATSSLKGLRLRRDRAVRADHDLLDARLRLAQLGFAVPLQERAALVGADRLVELGVAGFQAPHDLLELVQRVLEAQPGDLGRRSGFGHHPLGANS